MWLNLAETFNKFEAFNATEKSKLIELPIGIHDVTIGQTIDHSKAMLHAKIIK